MTPFRIVDLRLFILYIKSSYSSPLLIMVNNILNRPFGFIKFDECAGMIIPWPAWSKLDFLLITICALPSMIWTKLSKGEVFSFNPSPLSKDITLISPEDFLIIVLITTELAIYSIISTIMCDFDFSRSALPGFPFLLLLTMIFNFVLY